MEHREKPQITRILYFTGRHGVVRRLCVRARGSDRA
jgi:hypothetical protein